MEKDKVEKRPRFGYFHVKFWVDEKVLDKSMKKYKDSIEPINVEICSALTKLKEDVSSEKDLFKLVLLELKNKNITGFQEVGGKKIDVDISTFRPNAGDENHIYFQIANNRNDTIYKKKIGSEREMVNLEDDEYIGEYCNVFYHFEKRILLFQRNKYSVSVSQFTNFFRLCISNYYQQNIPKEQRIFLPIILELVPDLDEKMLDKIKRGNIGFEKIKICGDIAKINCASKWNMPCIQSLEKIINGF